MKNDLRIKNKIIYFFLIFFGIFTIFYQIHFDDLWLDEMASFWIADPTLLNSETIERQMETDWHNPILFNLILKNFLKLFGYNPDFARYLPLIFGSLSLFMFGLISYQEKKNSYFLLATFLACVSIYIIKYSQELRPYSLILLTSCLNIFFFMKLLKSQKLNSLEIFFFISFSVVNYSVNPFTLIIFFSQIIYTIYRYILFQDKLKMILLFYMIIFIFFSIFNYNYILYQITFENYMLSSDIKNVLDGFYFPRFFGSKIMGYLYLILLIYLIYKNRKIFFLKDNNYMFFLILIVFCYLVPLSYGIIRTPVFHDRYIIFILIPLFVLIPLLISEISNSKLKKIITSLLVLITLSNHYIEIFYRVHTKPEFKKTLMHIDKSDTNNIMFSIRDHYTLVSNYVRNIKIDQTSQFIFSSYDEKKSSIKKFWLFCYTTDPDFICDISYNNNFEFTDSQKNLFVETKLYKSN